MRLLAGVTNRFSLSGILEDSNQQFDNGKRTKGTITTKPHFKSTAYFFLLKYQWNKEGHLVKTS
jgi:hypothetical protein